MPARTGKDLEISSRSLELNHPTNGGMQLSRKSQNLKSVLKDSAIPQVVLQHEQRLAKTQGELIENLMNIDTRGGEMFTLLVSVLIKQAFE